ncbi:aminopeptidase [uncultured Lutibacter sp.]|uniref:aminopeptidase n=1 Tax=uncultured Lutibacter sp. TaxID=437739 RepID=UPI002638165E|nr:aminopeptidase [uncultured Lutibacter sp.]
MKKNLFLIVLTYFVSLFAYAQTNNISISATLNIETNELKIKQETTFYNKSDSILNEVYFHNWANAYKDKNTPLAKRFIENYSKSFHFTNEKNRGNTTINSISVNYDNATWEITDENPDILKVNLIQPLNPDDSVKITATYIVKIPNDKFTSYGASYFSYNLKYWYLAPANFSTDWQTYNNLDMDDLYIDFTNYQINLKVPKEYEVNSNLTSSVISDENFNIYNLVGKNRLDIELNITKNNNFIHYNFEDILITTNLDSEKLDYNLKYSILKREFYFIQTFLGKFPNEKLLINKIDYDKNPVYGFNQLPSFLAAYSDAFEWDIQQFKVLSKKYIDELFLFNKREDYWLADGLQTYLMIKYVERYYPEVKAIGNISEVWGIKGFNLAKINFNEKYPFVYQFAARKNIDQPLTTHADSLSNFNRKIVNKYKAGLGIKYLETYLEDNSMPSIIWDFSNKNSGIKVQSNSFIDFLKSKTEKDISWFENEYLKTNKKVDYTIQKITKNKDSLDVTILNKRSFTTPIQLYGINNKEIKFTKWLTGIDSISKITIPKNGFDKLSLNYESLLPEFNLRNNWKSVDKKIFNRPFQLKFMKDIENPYYNQFFYTPEFRYNYYDGAVLGLTLSNKTILDKSFNYKVTPSYGTTSKTLSGSFALKYEYLPEDKKVNKFVAGIFGSSFHYAEDLSYNTLTPFALLEFKRKSLRDVSSNAISASYTLVDREKSPTQIEYRESNKYKVFNLSYGYSKPEIIEDVRFSTGIQVSEKFSKISLTGHYRKLTDTNRQFDFRIFAGAFLSNKTESDFFSFALDRPSDYLFQYDYLGRSETSGFFSQQVIINEGGFKSKLPVAYGNEWLSTINTSVGLWRWLEVYNDVGFVKNKNQKVYFAHENGLRLNFIQDILEVYFPLHSNLGWEISQPSYSSKIRFVLVINPKRIYNFVKRGFY